MREKNKIGQRKNFPLEEKKQRPPKTNLQKTERAREKTNGRTHDT